MITDEEMERLRWIAEDDLGNSGDEELLRQAIIELSEMRKALRKIAAGGFNCAPRQYYIAAQGIALKALGMEIEE